jgi:hypothetical protein
MPDVVLLPFALIADTMRRWSDAHGRIHGNRPR